jgi:hypothetical protein
MAVVDGGAVSRNAPATEQDRDQKFDAVAVSMR